MAESAIEALNAIAARLFDYADVAGYAGIADDLRQAARIARAHASLRFAVAEIAHKVTDTEAAVELRELLQNGI